MEPTYQTQILDHLGLVAAMFDELEIGHVIDQRIAQDTEQRKVSIGQAVKAMVLNGLGFVNQRLYLVPRFFETKPTERLVGPAILPEHLNDDTLGRALDSLYEAGLTELFRDVATHAAKRLGLKPRFAHLDATSFHLDGTYNSKDEEVEEGVVHIRPGYSRDHRPDLNQVVLGLMVEHQAGLPLLMEPLSGNASDAVSFRAMIQAHLAQLQVAHGMDYLVADSALYSRAHIEALNQAGTRFITRIPETITEAQAVIAEAEYAAMTPLSGSFGEGSKATSYRALVHAANYGGVEQRWLVVHSEAAQARAAKAVARRQRRKHEHEQKAFRKLSGRVYSCRADAQRALMRFEADLMASELVEPEVLECVHMNWGQTSAAEVNGSEPVSYRLRGRLVFSEAKQQALLWRKSCFIIGTNEVDEAVLSNEELLAGYKGQGRVERGFRFLKDPLFLASSLFLRSEKRIMALLMVMTLCLLVYAALEWRIRQGLKAHEATIPDQKGKPTARPTARWVFYSFEGIHVLLVGGQQLVLNLQAHHHVILLVLGSEYQSYYASRAP